MKKSLLLLLLPIFLIHCFSDEYQEETKNKSSTFSIENTGRNLEPSVNLKKVVKSFIDSCKTKEVHGQIFIDRFSMNESYITVFSKIDSVYLNILSEPMYVLKYKNALFDIYMGGEPILITRNSLKRNSSSDEDVYSQCYIDSVGTLRYIGRFSVPFEGYAEIVNTRIR